MQAKSIAEWEHSAILLTCIKLPPVLKTFVLSISEWPLKTGFTVVPFYHLLAISERYYLSVDYQHSQTSITPLMIAAGRGFSDVVEQLLNMGADAAMKGSNDWTALDWAKKFQRDDIVDILEAHL